MFRTATAALIAVLGMSACAAPVTEAQTPPVSMCGDTATDAANRAALTSLDAEYQDPVADRGTESGVPWCVFSTYLSPNQYWAAVYAGTDNPSWDFARFPSVRLSHAGWVGFVTGTDGRPWTVQQAATAAKKLAKSFAS